MTEKSRLFQMERQKLIWTNWGEGCAPVPSGTNAHFGLFWQARRCLARVVDSGHGARAALVSVVEPNKAPLLNEHLCRDRVAYATERYATEFLRCTILLVAETLLSDYRFPRHARREQLPDF